MATKRNIEIIRGDTVTKTWTLKENGSNFSLTGKNPVFSVKYAFSDSDSSAVIYKAFPTPDVTVSGSNVSVLIKTLDTAYFPNFEIPLVYELAVLETGNIKKIFASGLFIVYPSAIDVISLPTTGVSSYSYSFTGSSVSIPSWMHGLTAPLLVRCYVTDSGVAEQVNASIMVTSHGDVSVNFGETVTGYLVLLG